MKTRFKKYASVFLCLVLILGVFMPMSNVGIVKAETTEKEAAIAKLKAAWGKMYSQETLLYPNIQKVSGSNMGADGIYASADGLEEALPEGITANDLGDYYSYHSKIFSTTGTAENRFMWFNTTSSSATYGSVDLSQYDDIRVSYYVEEVAVEGSFNVQMITTESKTPVSKGMNIAKSDEGKWKTITAADIHSSGMQGIKDAFGIKKLGFFQLGLGANATKFKGWFGSLVGVKYTTVPELEGVELVAAAKKLDLTDCLNTAAFVEALAAAEGAYAEELITYNLKTAWSEVVVSAESKLYPTAFRRTANTDQDSGLWANGTAASDEEKAYIGEKYVSHDMVAADGRTATAESSNTYTMFMGDGTQFASGNTKTTGTEADGWIYVRINSVTTAGRLGFKLVYNGDQQRVSNYYVDVTEANKGKWIKVSLNDLMPMGNVTDWKTFFTENTLTRFELQLVDGAQANLSVGTVMFANGAAVPELEGVELVKAAMELDYSKYMNTEGFVAALNAAKEFYKKEFSLMELKAAWSKVVVSSESKLYPTAFRRTANTDQDSGLWANGIAASDEEKAFIGEKYVSHDMVAADGRTATAVSSNTYTLFMGDGTQFAAGNTKTTGTETDGWIYVKINDITTEGRLGFKLVYNGDQQRVSNYYVDVTEANKGEWIKVSLNDLMPMGDITNWKTDFAEGTSNILTRFELQLVNGAEANLSVGTLMFAKTAQVPALDGLELVMAADKFDISNYSNTEDFVAALNAAKECYKKEFSLINLKAAWGKLISAESKFYPTAYRQKGDKSDQIDNLWANGIAASDAEKAFIGEKYVTLNIEDLAGRTTVSAYDNSYNLFIATTGTSLDATVNSLGNEVDGWLYIRINSVTAGGRLGFKWVKNGNAPAASGHYIDVSNVNEGEWIKVDLDDAIPGWKDDFVAGNNNFSRFEIQPVDGAKVNLSVGTVMFAYAPQVPEFDGIKLIDAAKEFDSTGYINAAAFEEALAVAEEEYSAELELLESNKAIKNAYGKMYTEAVTGLYPNAEKVNNASAALIDNKNDRFFTTSSVAELPFGANAEMLGDNYARYTIADNVETTNYYGSENRILFYAKKGSVDQNNIFDISEYDGFYFNVYYNAVNHDGKLGFFIVSKNNVANIKANVIDVTKELNEGKWVTYTDKDVCEGGLETIKTKFGENGIAALMVNLENLLDIEAYVGSIVFYKEIEPSEADIASDTFLSEMRNTDLSGLYNKEQFVNTIIDNTNDLAVKYADNEEIIEKIKFADDCNAYGGVDLKDLVRMARYNDNSEAVKIDKLAADGNEDKVINDLDEALLRAKLLQR